MSIKDMVNEAVEKQTGSARIDVIIPEDLKKQAQHVAIDDGISLTDVVITALRMYLNNPDR